MSVDETVNHEAIIRRVRQTIPPSETINDMTQMLKTFGDKTRATILYALYESELRVLDIASILDMSQSSVSHQLRALKEAKLVKNRKVGKEVLYSLADDHIINIFRLVLEHVNEIENHKKRSSDTKS
ncbi:ArsR/SmtB family transcription factor [Agrilactobacillus fermenti]|uniref:ArsR/SmtB family transcription factor n=1 Tax=Agrilactobacillus fermenti TaxID=2586909 RepID=UPI001E3E5616|nr:metalloregulator ArsR/SmtB family transcription factor [Agrilactobacillus fermenti]